MDRERQSRFEPLRTSLRAKVTISIVLPLLLILGTFTIIEYTRHRKTVLYDLSLLAAQSGKVVESSLRHAMLESDFAEMQIILDSIGETENFRVVFLMDTDGRVIFAPQGRDTGIQLNNNQPDCLPCHRLEPDARPESIIVVADDGQRVFRNMYPIENSPECSTCHDPDNKLIGLLLTDIPVAPVEAALAADLRENLLWWAVTILVSIVVVNIVLSRIVIRRLKGLAEAITNFGQGNLNLRLPIGEPDEIGQLADAFNKMGQQIEAETNENRDLSLSLQRKNIQRGELLKRLISAQEDERKRVARELHDDLGQALSALSIQTEVIERLIVSDPDRVIEQLEETQSLVSETSDRMHDLILALRPSALDDLGLVSALQTYCERILGGSGVAFELDSNRLSRRLTPEAETALYRIYQEAINNICRHSGAEEVRITLFLQNGAFEGEIWDNGRGFDLDSVNLDGGNPRGLGLLGMQERAAICGGHLELISQPGSGTRIRVYIPLEAISLG
jgi:signal transduction histidine kinase